MQGKLKHPLRQDMVDFVSKVWSHITDEVKERSQVPSSLHLQPLMSSKLTSSTSSSRQQCHLLPYCQSCQTMCVMKSLTFCLTFNVRLF